MEEKKLRKAEFEAGVEYAATETARRMLNLKKFSLEEIAAISGLSLDEVRKLQKKESSKKMKTENPLPFVRQRIFAVIDAVLFDF